MPELTTKVLVVDDDPDFCDFAIEILQETYSVTKCTQPELVIDQCAEEKPDIILMDINLSNANGYELCKQIKTANDEYQNSVIFISGHDDEEQYIKSFEAGGDHFVQKPINVKELHYKVNAISKYLESKKNQTEKNKLAQKVAFSSMEEASCYGLIMQFLKKEYSTTNSLIQYFFECLKKLDINASLKMQREDSVIFLRDGEYNCSPIEKDVFNILKNRGRIYSFGSRLIINDKNISLLVKNMPIDNEAKSGLLRDALIVLVEGFRSRIIEIWRKELLFDIVRDIKNLLDKVNDNFQDFRGNTVKVMDQVQFDISTSMRLYDFTEAQEEYISSIIEDGLMEMVSAQEHGAKITDEFERVICVAKKALGDH